MRKMKHVLRCFTILAKELNAKRDRRLSHYNGHHHNFHNAYYSGYIADSPNHSESVALYN